MVTAVHHAPIMMMLVLAAVSNNSYRISHRLLSLLLFTTAHSLDTATIACIVVGIILFIAIIFALIGLCLCCYWSRCPCFYKNQFYYDERAILINHRRSSPQTLQADHSHALTAVYPPSMKRQTPPPPYNPEGSYPPLQSKGYQTIPPSAPRY